MDQWESMLENCKDQCDPNSYNKVIQTASVVLKQDLTQFEIEWILQTLLHKPLNLLQTINVYHASSTVQWNKVLANSFKLISETVENLKTLVEPHFEDIVNVCYLNLEPSIRKNALLCLTSVAKVSPLAARDLSVLVSSLENVTTCKAPLALLVGTICEYHPETVEDFNRIWRNFLILLDTNKNTPTIISSLLEGVLGLFKHFGADLPTAELNEFYDKLQSNYLHDGSEESVGVRKTLQRVCFKILAYHADLFRERVSQDSRLRSYLWRHLEHCKGTSALGIKAVKSVYSAMCEVLDASAMQRIATEELAPKTISTRSQVKYTALRIVAALVSRCGAAADVEDQVDGGLELELRSEGVSYDVAEAVAFCIEANLSSSESLLQAAMVYYGNLPHNRRKEIVVHSVLNTSSELRRVATHFLISESISDKNRMEYHLHLWRDMFDDRGGKDEVVLEKSKHVFEDYMNYTIFVVENFLEDNWEKIPEKLNNLFQLTTHVLTFQPQEDYTAEYCRRLLDLLLEVARSSRDATLLSTIRCAVNHLDQHFDGLREFYESLNIDRCKDETVLCESCLTLIQASEDLVNVDNVLMALQVILTRGDVEAAILLQAVRKLDSLLVGRKVDAKRAGKVIQEIEKIRHRKVFTSKDERTLQKEITLFLGKYGVLQNSNFIANINLVRLRDNLTLSIPNTDEGIIYKLNLQRIIHLALEYEEPDSLESLLVIISASLSSRADANLQEVLALVCRALCRAYARGAAVHARALHAALATCRAVATIVQCISEEKSPGVRKMLSDALEEVLTQDSAGDELVWSVYELAAILMGSHEITKKRAGLNITESLLVALKDNNDLCKEKLPELLKLITNTLEQDSNTTFDVASKIYMDKVELFEENEVKLLIKELVEISTRKIATQNDGVYKMADANVRSFKNTSKMVVEFVRSIVVYKKWNDSLIIEIVFEKFNNECCQLEKMLYFLAELRENFDFDTDLCRNVVSHGKCMVPNRLFSLENCMERNYLCMEAVLKFLAQYHDVLLESKYEETLKFLSEIVKSLKPTIIKKLHKEIKSCISMYTKNKVPQSLQKSFEHWCSKLPLEIITISIEKESFSDDHSIIVSSLKKMMQLFDVSNLTEVSKFAAKWPKILQNLYAREFITKHLKSKMSYLSDLLTVSVRLLTVIDVKKLLLEGCDYDGLPAERIGVKFCSFFIHVFFEVLVRKPYLLLDTDMDKSAVILNDIVKFSLKRKCTTETLENILELVERLWPTYFTQSTPNQKRMLLLDLNNYPTKLPSDSLPMRWVVDILTSDAAIEEKTRVLPLLPGGEAYSAAYRSFASTLPARISDVRARSAAALRALLDALAATCDVTLLDIVVSLAANDETEGWWDDAIEACMAQVAAKAALSVTKGVYTRVCELRSLPACDRVLLPLLRYSTTSTCEKLLSSSLGELLATPKKPSTHNFRRCIAEYTITCKLLELAFTKLPISSLESTDSCLYRELNPRPSRPWEIVRSVCKICFTLKHEIKLPEDADDQLKEDFRTFCCANYKCFAAAIMSRRPEEKMYSHLFDVAFWDTLVDQTQELTFRIHTHWNQRPKQLMSSEDNPEGSPSNLSSVSLRTRLFTTLSEDPLLYDLLETAPQEEEGGSAGRGGAGAGRGAGAAVAALLAHAAATARHQWPPAVGAALAATGGNTRWMIAQAVCDVRESLKCRADAIYPALMELEATSADKGVLHGLHIDIIETLIFWKPALDGHSPHLTQILKSLITTTLEYRKYTSVYNTMKDVLSKFLDTFSSYIGQVNMEIDDYLNDSEASKTVKVLGRVCKANIAIPTVLPTLLQKMEASQCQLSNLAELFGLALSSCGNRTEYLNRFKRVLEKLRNSNIEEYIKALYNAQSGCLDCCDEYHFRMTTDQTQKIVGSEKAKCLQILSRFAATHPDNEYVLFMYESIDLPDMILAENTDAFDVVKTGIKVFTEGMKRQLVNLCAGYCHVAVDKLKRAAFEVMIEAFDDLFNNKTPDDPKRRKLTLSPLAHALLSDDSYANTVLNAISKGCVEKDSNIHCMVRERVSDIMSRNMEIRFLEAYLLTVHRPAMTNNKSLDLCVCVSAMLDLLLRDVRSKERFKQTKLRDEPLERRVERTDLPKLLTMSTAYQGTLSTHPNLSRKRGNNRKLVVNQDSPDIDVTVPIDSIVETFLKFAQATPEASLTIYTEVLQSIKSAHKFDSSGEIAKSLTQLLSLKPNVLTPLIIATCELFANDLCQTEGIMQSLETLKKITTNSQGEYMVKLLYQHINSLLTKEYIFGIQNGFDVIMDEVSEFSVDDLTYVFGKLSNWDLLTIKQKRDIRNSGLPPLWTDPVNFKTKIDENTQELSGWFAKMVLAYKQEGKDEVMSWLRGMNTWPQRRFDLSATTEAILWLTSDELSFTNALEIHPSDCLAEWAARLMIRSAHHQQVLEEPSDSQEQLSRSQELSWCVRASEMGLGVLVLDCVKRNCTDAAGESLLTESEALPWFVQQISARRQMALGGTDGDAGALGRLLDNVETNAPNFIEKSTADAVVGLQKLTLSLRRDVNGLSNENVMESLNIVNSFDAKEVTNKRDLIGFYELAMNYYDDDELWKPGKAKSDTLCAMLTILERIAGDSSAAGLLAMALNKLELCGPLGDFAAKQFVDVINLYLPTMDEFSLSAIKSNRDIFPSRLHSSWEVLSEREDDTLVKYKACLSLVCDAQYSLKQICASLMTGLGENDSEMWAKTFQKLKDRIFENPYSGSDYQLLNKYKSKLYAIEKYESTPTFSRTARESLREIIARLPKTPTANLRVSQLCPTLSHCADFPTKLLGLRDNLSVVRIDEKVQVFTDSIRRPVVLKVLLSNGTSRKYLLKTGEPLAVDAAAQGLVRHARELWRPLRCGVRGYCVVPLSDDSGLIEFLEDHVRLRDLIKESCDLDGILSSVALRTEREILATPLRSIVSDFEKLRDKIPKDALRNGLLKRCTSEQHKHAVFETFQNTLASSSIITWLLGTGDRHLQNILYGSQDGGVCPVDWGASGEWAREPPPARLPAPALRLTHAAEFEAMLQRLLSSVRASRRQFCAVLKISFRQVDGFQDKLHYITSIVEGKWRSCDVTKRALIDDCRADFERSKLTEIIDEVFEEFETKDNYDVEEQITCFLRHCTDSRILGVTRPLWEPWV